MSEDDIFLEALEFADPEERAKYLDRACAGNAELRAAVESLLESHDEASSFLDEPALRQMLADEAASGGSSVGSERPLHREEIDLSFLEPSTAPDSLGRLHHFEIRGVAGHGSFGIVLKAFDTKLERIVAVKIMTAEIAAMSPARKRFLREARAMSAIRHENVVRVFDIREQPRPYLVMEYVDGETLQQRIDRVGPLEIQDILHIGRQVAAGLAAAHAKGLIHRDIKPANILLENRTNNVRITDFGLARAADDASVTQSGVLAGTPLYMSPEQAQGLEIDARSDLFSLGSVLYVMCSGRPPFRAANSFAVLKRVVYEKARPIQQIIPEVPGWLVAVVARLHEKNPKHRYASAHLVEAALDPSPDVDRRWNSWRTRRPLSLGFLLVIACLAVALFGMAIQFAGVMKLPRPSVHRPISDASPTSSPILEPKPLEAAELVEPVEAAEPMPEVPEPEAPIVAETIDLMPLGSYWLGERTYRRGAYQGGTVHYELHVTERHDNVFRGHVFDNGKGRNRAQVEGVIQGETIVWTEQARGNTLTMKATRDGDQLTVHFHGVYSNGATNIGDGRLTLIRPASPAPATDGDSEANE
jgi:serine/threonine protein kinase